MLPVRKKGQSSSSTKSLSVLKSPKFPNPGKTHTRKCPSWTENGFSECWEKKDSLFLSSSSSAFPIHTTVFEKTAIICSILLFVWLIINPSVCLTIRNVCVCVFVFRKTKLLFFNRQEEDVLWHRELDELAANDERYSSCVFVCKALH